VLAKAWTQSNQQLDVLASHLIDMDDQGHLHGVIRPTALEALKSPDDWLAQRPHVVGAAQAWSRRLFDRFGPLPRGVVAEDLVMVFRAVASGGGLTVPEPLVHYRRGGLSGRKQRSSAQAVVAGWLKSNHQALIEAQLMLQDCDKVKISTPVRQHLENELRQAQYLAALFAPSSRLQRLHQGITGAGMPWGKRPRLITYAVCPEALLPFFWLKSRLRR
jgi:hypothetical protein